MRMLAVVVIALASQTACGTFGGLGRTAADVLLPVPEENKLGAELAKQVESKAKLHPSAELQRYVQSVGQKVAAKAQRYTPKGIRYTYKVIDDDKTVNAFALPGGHIYVTSGLLKLMDSEAQLAAALSHETAHVALRHVAQRLVAQYGVETVLGLAFGKDPSAVEQIAGQLIEGGTLVRFTRAEEEEADAVGMPFMVAAGYDPNGMVRLFEELQQKAGKQSTVLSYLSDHPVPAQRIADAKKRIARMHHSTATTTNRERYEQMMRLL